MTLTRLAVASFAGIVLLSSPPVHARQEDDFKKRVDLAVDKGVEWIRGLDSMKKVQENPKEAVEYFIPCYRSHWLGEFAALTLLVAGVEPGDPLLKALIEAVNLAPWRDTYNVALRACIYAILLDKNPDDGDSFIRLALTMKFLIETQLPNGRWSYGFGYLPGGSDKAYQPTASATVIDKNVRAATQALTDFGVKLRDEMRKMKKDAADLKEATLSLAIRREGKLSTALTHGDYSNSQFAALGLLAASRSRLRLAPGVFARLQLPGTCVESALSTWLADQESDGGWSYTSRREDFSTGRTAYGSMTCGGLFAIESLKRVADGVDPKGLSVNDAKKLKAAVDLVGRASDKAARWIGDHFKVDANPDAAKIWEESSTSLFLYYYLFSLERAASHGKREKFGKSDWYGEGAAYILKAQESDGGWPAETFIKDEEERAKKTPKERQLISTGFSILFLRRATAKIAPPDVATPGGGKKR